MLLQWCTLEPAGPSNLAAIRFASPVRIQYISIFPTDAQPFAQDAETISRTEPDAFFLELFFNAHPVALPHSKEKPKPTNALVSTVIAYAGGRADFAVNMSSELSTRLMIVKGAFESVSMAIYGDVVNELPLPKNTYEPRPVPSLDPIPLSSALDPANARDPTRLASQLLDLISDAPPLPLIIRLMFCLKPSNEDWDLPEFPNIFSTLDQLPEDATVEDAYNFTSRPAADSDTAAWFVEFAERIARMVDSPDANQSYHISGVLSHVACQHPEMASSVVNRLELQTIFTAPTLDEGTLEFLLEAAANPDIARKLNEPTFKETIESVANHVGHERRVRTVAQQLLDRIDGVTVLEDALSNTQGDFIRAVSTLKDIARQEMSFGILLTSLVTHPDLVDKLAENPTMSTTLRGLPALLSDPTNSMSHDDFIAFLRAFIGVSCVLVVHAWADSVPDERCRERALGILRLWQGVDGYCELLDHLLLLRQMVFRLNWMLDSDIPTRGKIDAETILLKLSREPSAIMRPAFTDCMLNLKPPHCVITYEEQESLYRAADIADRGLPGAVDCLLQPIEQPPTFSSLRALRVALGVVAEELSERDEYEVLQEFWQEGSCSLQTCLVDILSSLSDEIGGHFSVEPPPPTTSEVLTQMLKAAGDTISIILRIAPAYPLPSRTLRAYTIAAANLFVCTDVVDVLFLQTSPACIAAQEVRQACISSACAFAEFRGELQDGKSNAQVVLHTLLEHGIRSGLHEPVHHLLQIFCLIDYLLPTPDTQSPVAWGQTVLPSVLRELWTFCRALDTENKAHLVRRLVALDRGVVGLGEWILQEELKELTYCLNRLQEFSPSPHYRLIGLYHASLSLRLLCDLMSGASSEAVWCVTSLTSSAELAKSFANCLQLCLALNISSRHLTKIVRVLAAESASLQDAIKLPLSMTLLRTSQHPGGSASEVTSLLCLAQSLLLSCPSYIVLANQVSAEVSNLVRWLESSPYLCEGDLPSALVDLLDWFTNVDDPALMGYTGTSFGELCDQIRPCLDSGKQEILLRLMDSLHHTEDIAIVATPVPLPDNIELGTQDLEDLLQRAPPPSTPPRKALTQDVLSNLVAISPPTALIRSPNVTGLTKTYLNNDFRQLRQTPSTRQNTSRLPSMHVDDFENAASSPAHSPVALPLPLAVPLTGPGAAGTAMPFAAGTQENFASMSPLFKLL